VKSKLLAGLLVVGGRRFRGGGGGAAGAKCRGLGVIPSPGAIFSGHFPGKNFN